MTNKTCTCFIRHAVTAEERKATSDALEYARKVNDAPGVIAMYLASLSGKCPARA